MSSALIQNFCTTAAIGTVPGLIVWPCVGTAQRTVWQSSHQPNWARQNFSPTKELIPIYLLNKKNILVVVSTSFEHVQLLQYNEKS